MMTTTQCQCGGTIDALQRASGEQGLDFLRTRCGGCGAEQIFHGHEAREVAAVIDASNQQPKQEQD
jgi:alpha-D-ribose 1-methylphosphonate 5-triphosphate synthase subunit PhnG